MTAFSMAKRYTLIIALAVLHKSGGTEKKTFPACQNLCLPTFTLPPAPLAVNRIESNRFLFGESPIARAYCIGTYAIAVADAAKQLIKNLLNLAVNLAC